MSFSKELIVLSVPALALGLYCGWRKRRASWPEWLAAAMLPLLLGALAAIYWETAALNTRWVWSACRLAPTLGLFHGYPLYSPADSGPVNGWLYGPVGALAWAPAALAGSPLPALGIAAAINLLFLLVPLLVAVGCSLAKPGVPGLLAFVFGAATLLQIYPTWYMASALNVDAIAVGLGAGSCLVLLRSNPVETSSLWLAAGLAGLAGWTKQTEAFLVLAQAGWLWFACDGKTARRYITVCAVTMIVATTLVGVLFPPEDVIFNLWSVPAAHALPGGWRAALTEVMDFSRYAMPFWLPCLLFFFVRDRRAPADHATNAAASPAGAVLLLVAAAAVMLPLGIMAAIKVGGDRNSMHSVYYLAVAATLTVARVWPVAARHSNRLLPAAMLFAVATVTLLAVRQVAGYATLAGPPSHCLSQEAWSYARAHPGEVYYPWDPLATLMAEGRMYHFEYGVIDRSYAGRTRDAARMRRDLPAGLKVVIYPRADYSRMMLRDYLTEFSFATATEDWLIYPRKNPP